MKKSFLHTMFFSLLLLMTNCNDKPDDNSKQSAHEGMKGMDSMEKETPDSLDLKLISLPANYSVISSQKIVHPVWSENSDSITLNGYIVADERRDNKISARVNGRIEKLYVKYNFQYVKKGEKVIEIYSAELNTIQEELLFLKKKSEYELVKKTEEKLRLLGISEPELKKIKASDEVLRSLSIVSPYEGYVYFTNDNSPSILSPSSMMLMDGMEGGNDNKNTTISENINGSSSQIREGDYVNKGQTLFKVNDLKEVWGMISIDNNLSSELSVTTPVKIASEMDKENPIQTSIKFIEPVFQSGQKFLLARIYLKNESGLLKINSLFTATIKLNQKKRLWVPLSSVLSLGNRKVVWITTDEKNKNTNTFFVRDIGIGKTNGKMIEVTSGLTEKDRIALDAAYMIDRESLIQPQLK